uniref:hypothetical protein n=1 Tax=Bradyrhizobium sp. (strain ORS 278) TaxID=114615 RepID=UPI0002E5BDC0|nr:hypothetical protein [Bradyrhizobium sp. ORS 278]
MFAAMLVGATLSGCAGQGGSSFQQGAGSNAAPVSDPIDDEIARVEAREKALSPAYLQRRRQAIAEMLENNPGFGAALRVPLTGPLIAGPKVMRVRTWTSLISSTITVRTVYCVKALLDSPLELYALGSAYVEVEPGDQGTERLHGGVFRGNFGTDRGPLACYKAAYAPFPELEQVRAQKRQALGKTS